MSGRVAFRADDARGYIAEVRWQFAKLIRRDGIVKLWPRDAAKPRYRLTYLELDGWEYWSMGAPFPETTVINRAKPS